MKNQTKIAALKNQLNQLQEHQALVEAELDELEKETPPITPIRRGLPKPLGETLRERVSRARSQSRKPYLLLIEPENGSIRKVIIYSDSPSEAWSQIGKEGLADKDMPPGDDDDERTEAGRCKLTLYDLVSDRPWFEGHAYHYQHYSQSHPCGSQH